MAENSKTAKLVHVTTVPQFLGFFRGQISYMKARGFRVHAISSPGERLDQFARREQVPVHAIDMFRGISPLKDIIALFRLWRCFRRIRPHIVHAHTPKAGLLSTIAAWLARVPVQIYHIHCLRFMTCTGLKRAVLVWSEKVACCLAQQILCVSPSVREALVQMRLCPADKVKVLLKGSINGIDAMGRFNPDEIELTAGQRKRSEYGIPSDALVVGFVGRIVRDKGLVELAEAWRALREEFSDLHLLIVGSFEPQDPVPAQIEQLLRTDPRVHLPGWVEDMAETYAAMDVVALPTYREGFPSVPLEAAALGLPVVGTSVPGCVDAVEDGVTGTLVPARDAGALADALRRYLNDPELRRRHGQAGRERVLRDFRPEPIWEALYQEYVRLLKEKGLPMPHPAPESKKEAVMAKA